MPAEFLTVREVAERLKLNPQTVRRWIRAGLLPAYRVGRRQWRVREQDLERHAGPQRPARSRREVVSGIRRMADRLAGRGINLDELMAESRRELEGRGAARGH
jgi:excisionase family DNA binding protein